MNKEILFLVEHSEDGGYIAKAVNHSIFTEADTLEELKSMIKDAVECHFEKEEKPQLIHLHIVRDEVILA